LGPQGLAAHQKKARRLKASLVFIDETGFLLAPLVRRTWAPIGQTPILSHRTRHHRRVSAIGALSISPERRRLGLYLQFHTDCSICQEQVLAFLRYLRRHLRHPIILIWDRLNAHRGQLVQQYMEKASGLYMEYLPPYAPELNPNEYCWSHLKNNPLANYCPENVDQLHGKVLEVSKPLHSHQSLLSGFVRASKLPVKLKNYVRHY
jgi:transposase